MTTSPLLLIGIAVGSAIGGVARVVLSERVADAVGGALHAGTLVVNVLGSFAIGLVASVALVNPKVLGGPAGHQAVMAGVLGGFTTFSAFSLQTLVLMQQGRWMDAAANVVLSVLVCLGAVWLGWQAGVMHQG